MTHELNDHANKHLFLILFSCQRQWLAPLALFPMFLIPEAGLEGMLSLRTCDSHWVEKNKRAGRHSSDISAVLFGLGLWYVCYICHWPNL